MQLNSTDFYFYEWLEATYWYVTNCVIIKLNLAYCQSLLKLNLYSCTMAQCLAMLASVQKLPLGMLHIEIEFLQVFRKGTWGGVSSQLT